MTRVEDNASLSREGLRMFLMNEEYEWRVFFGALGRRLVWNVSYNSVVASMHVFN